MSNYGYISGNVDICSNSLSVQLTHSVLTLDKLSSCIFVTLRYRDEDPIVEKPGAVITANYASVTIISHKS